LRDAVPESDKARDRGRGGCRVPCRFSRSPRTGPGEKVQIAEKFENRPLGPTILFKHLQSRELR